ncbi:MAG: PilZ domain-containing protein [Pseudomonadota bacterium]
MFFRKIRDLVRNGILKIPYLQPRYVRRHKRYSCCIVAAMHVTERHFEIEGVILELSQGGLLFRQASRYIMDRSQEFVSIRFEGLVLTGQIVNISSQGYGVLFDEELTADRVQMLITTYGLRTLKARPNSMPQGAPQLA